MLNQIKFCLKIKRGIKYLVPLLIPFYICRFFDRRDAEDAMDALNGRTYDGRDLRITVDAGRPTR